MDNFDIEEGTTNSELTDDVRKSAKLNQAKSGQNSQQKSIENHQKIYDEFDKQNCALSVVFKIIAIAIYLLLWILTDSSLTTFIITALLLSFDFWVTKNLTARKLVGLRWWSQITENGQQQWIFQSRNPARQPHSFNVAIFWIGQLLSLIFWGIIFIINIFTFSLFWIGLAFFCELLTAINFICFFKCRGQHQSKAQQWGKKFGIKNASQMF